ncbi:Sec7 domain-containing protein, partial [Mrakia frigida]|uniref:Sec7 domain-containing protein n=1 Tax=Mrakia frigida TaxID=29902 RepID=UPI003FCC2033
MGTGVGQPMRPSQLDNPPRKLLLYVPVLQVVNNNTVKDRFLFLFTDILLIAKPILPEGHLPSLETKFIVKSVVELHKLKLSGLKDDDGSSDSSKRQHPVVASFIEMFSQKTEEAMDLLTHKSNLQGDNIASLLFKTPELDKAKLGDFFSSSANLGLLQGFVARFPFGGVRVDEALRIFLLSMRLPSEAAASDVLLEGFANAWHASNASVVTFDRELVLSLVMAIMQLNDYLNPSSSGFGNFAFANTSLTAEDFIQAFREHDHGRHIDDDLLRSIYVSVKSDRLSQALSASDIALERDIYLLPTRIATRLTYKVQSEAMCINIPDPDAHFSIRMHGAGLKFDPPVLNFANSSQATFRITGTSLGQKTILFSRTGANAALYPGLAPTKVFFVERAFMKVGHTLQIAFVREPTTTKRKYLYSFED